MWFQVEERALHDERLKLAANDLGMTHKEVFWGLCLLWCWLYKQGGRPMTPKEVDVVSEVEGFAHSLLANGLAEGQADGRLRIAGNARAKKYGEFCQRQKKRAEERYAQDDSQGNQQANESPNTNALPTAVPRHYQRTLFDLSDLRSDPDPESGKSKPQTKAARAKAAMESWLDWFNRSFARTFQGSQELQRAVGALLARGFSEKPDMRGVALFLRARWEGDEAMAKFLVPSSILRPSKFSERLDQAKEWARESGAAIWEGTDDPV